MAGNILVLFVIGWVLIVMSGAVFVSAYEWAVFYRMRKNTHVIDATVLELKNKRRFGFSITVEYEINKLKYLKELRISHKNFRRIKQNQKIPLKYIHNVPQIVRLNKEYADYTNRNISTFAAWGGILGFPYFILFWLISFVGCLAYFYYKANQTIVNVS